MPCITTKGLIGFYKHERNQPYLYLHYLEQGCPSHLAPKAGWRLWHGLQARSDPQTGPIPGTSIQGWSSTGCSYSMCLKPTLGATCNVCLLRPGVYMQSLNCMRCLSWRGQSVGPRQAQSQWAGLVRWGAAYRVYTGSSPMHHMQYALVLVQGHTACILD